MPWTVNGIGTMYYGKQRLERHEGVCGNCSQHVQLESYSTRLWGVFVFIPVIPLGRKKILDDCPRCRRHRVMPLRQWQRLEEEATRKAMQRAEAESDSPEAALEMLGTLVAFGRHNEADQLAEALAQRFADNADLQIVLGESYAQRGRGEQAHARFTRALELAPDSEVARRAVSIGLIERGELDRARAMLASTESLGPLLEPAVHALLADRYQAVGDHENALAIYESVLQAHPDARRDRALARRVRASQRALGRTESLVPRDTRIRNAVAVVAAAIALLAGGAFVYSSYSSRHQTLFVLNALPVSADITIDGDDFGSVQPRATMKISLAEGSHQAAIRYGDGKEETVDFAVENGPIERFTGKTAFVLNVAGAADVLWQEIVYRAVPRPGEGSHRIYHSQKFVAIRDIDYAFAKAPHEIDRGSKQSVTKTMLTMLDTAPAETLGLFPEGTAIPEMLEYAETHLRLDPEDRSLLESYCTLAVYSGEQDRCRAFLESGFDWRPIHVEWHCYYQYLATNVVDEATLTARYDRLVDECPKSAEAMYLRGRMEPDADKSIDYCRRAIEVDPKFAYAHHSLAYCLAARGDFKAARPWAETAHRLAPEVLVISRLWREVLLGLEEYSLLEQELREALANNLHDYKLQHALELQYALLTVLVGQGHLRRAEEAHRVFAEAAEAAPQAVVGSQLMLKYLKADFEGYQASTAQVTPPTDANAARLIGCIELGQLDQAEEILSADLTPFPSVYTLLLSHAWLQRGNRDKADKLWREALDQMHGELGQERRLVAALATDGGPPLEQLDTIVGQRETLAPALVALAGRYPAHRKAYLERARRLNLPGPFPYHFLRRAIAEMETQ
ncbi:MAG: tetratricopeptide repeat protein [Pirellulales bacterium]|nr:tetratricopeptide repeat protein [Pirellulales bacterium]